MFFLFVCFVLGKLHKVLDVILGFFTGKFRQELHLRMFLLLSLVIFIKFPLTKIHKYIKIVTLNYHRTESVAQRCSVKKVFLETSQNSQENTCAGDCFNKVAGLTP